MTSLYFVTPAYRRYDLTSVCLAQRVEAIDVLRAAGIEAGVVVVADDENLDLARAFGFDVVERDNEWLGRRFNDGIEYAAARGADWIVPIGSDSWLDPAYLLPLPAAGETRTSELYAAVEPTRLATLRVRTGRHGAGPYVLSRAILAPGRFRPAQDELRRRVDASTVRGLGPDVRWAYRHLHDLQYVGFRQAPMLTPYERLVAAWGVAEDPAPWARLATRYPAGLVEAARLALVGDAEAAA